MTPSVLYHLVKSATAVLVEGCNLVFPVDLEPWNDDLTNELFQLTWQDSEGLEYESILTEESFHGARLENSTILLRDAGQEYIRIQLLTTVRLPDEDVKLFDSRLQAGDNIVCLETTHFADESVH